ncbi:hypothetical protein [Streptomyces aureoverticillatus]|uniref:hypothetical protein n=1 Tax=Streptomyces aureoverticillatus TaxID=66871 RepID=UPI0013DA9C76|nr:hypothetical protein [Streptomyces aureoverticillatus]QIB46952.1 hypothetical protein G3H79_31570 [Streptomyces aureoverticillatus]
MKHCKTQTPYATTTTPVTGSPSAAFTAGIAGAGHRPEERPGAPAPPASTSYGPIGGDKGWYLP